MIKWLSWIISKKENAILVTPNSLSKNEPFLTGNFNGVRVPENFLLATFGLNALA
jgi:hypothetical protein